MVDANVGFLVERGRRADGFYVHRFDHKGGVLDARADLYDQAFMLLALAYAGRALQRSDLFGPPKTWATRCNATGGCHTAAITKGRSPSARPIGKIRICICSNASSRCIAQAAWRVGASMRRTSPGFAPARSSMRRAERCSNISM